MKLRHTVHQVETKNYLESGTSICPCLAICPCVEWESRLWDGQREEWAPYWMEQRLMFIGHCLSPLRILKKKKCHNPGVLSAPCAHDFPDSVTKCLTRNNVGLSELPWLHRSREQSIPRGRHSDRSGMQLVTWCAQSGSREWWPLVLHSLLPSRSVCFPSLGEGTTHIQGRSPSL